ncbi:uncharacterized protein LOC128556502 [Mercenaria mercenaria]|uniref:uncharacterized protein LOC128556502 n=1 Tax=Mercenaria mercenaria TaxID=6596 RepID=UPI00234F69FB|nr:uncharacterized protein LOC128556502 [Mercenaria mercenaria]
MAGLPEQQSRGVYAKQARLETPFDKFCTFSDKKAFCTLYKHMLSNRNLALLSDKITYCDPNAEDGKLFSKASCHASPVLQELYAFESIFNDGVKMLNDITNKDSYIPEDEHTKTLLFPLLAFLFDEESHRCLRSLSVGVENETQLMITLGMHFFSKLAVAKEFTMDKCAAKKDYLCICGNYEKKEILSRFDDTSIGHGKVWHGNVDIMLESCDIGVHCSPIEEMSPGGITTVEVKFCDLNSFIVRDHMLAQTITFSFLQQQRHPAFKHSLIPSILASNKSVQFFFYDSKNDILLESAEFDFFDYDGSTHILNYQAVIATWLVVNYRYLSSGPTESILNAPKAEFPEFAGDALDIYKSELKYRSVSETVEEKELPSRVRWKISRGFYDELPLKME